MKPKRINISLDARLHAAACERVSAELINGGFSGYLAQLIKEDLKKAQAGQTRPPASPTEKEVELINAVEGAHRQLVEDAAIRKTKGRD